MVIILLTLLVYCIWGERVPNATVRRIETDYIEPCKCTVVKIYTDLKMGGNKNDQL